MLKLITLISFCFCSLHLFAQPLKRTAVNAHSHNDYEQKEPFWAAYHAGFASIEADIFLVDGNNELLVAHTPAELSKRKRRLDSLYLIPLVECIRKNHGSPYSDKNKNLQILVDIKTSPAATLEKLVQTIRRYPELTNTPSLRFAISGNRPSTDSFALYPSFIQFDGEFGKAYSPEALSKLVLMSADLRHYTLWNGTGKMAAADSLKLDSAIKESHRMRKPVRFWDAPDNADAWKVLISAGVDFINTDKIEELSNFLRSTSAR